MSLAVRREPCLACPYRRDVASGVWSAEDYLKLPPYDAPTGEQPIAGFRCHATPDHLCNGWAIVHMNRGHEFELLAIRFARIADIPEPSAIVLFSSGTEAAEHGLTDIDDPSPEARRTAQRLISKYLRLQQ